MESVSAAAGLNFSNNTADCLCLPAPGLSPPSPSSPSLHPHHWLEIKNEKQEEIVIW